MNASVGGTNFRGLDALKRRARKADVYVGVPAGAREPDGTSTALVAAAAEFGTETEPERSFLRSTMREARKDFVALNRMSLRRVVDGTMSLRAALDLEGVYAVGRVKQKMLAGPFVPNAPSTIRAKGSDKPLFNSGNMFQSVTHKVEGA